MDQIALIMSVAFVFVAIILSLVQRLALEKDIIISTVRAFVQLMAIGYILQIIFDLERWPFILLMLALMTFIAGQNAAKRGKGIPKIQLIVTIAIALSEAVTLLLLLSLQIIDFSPRFIIPISGMVIGNSMVASGITLNRLKAEVE